MSADDVTQRDTGLGGDNNRCDRPATQPGDAGSQQWRGMTLHADRRKAVGDDEDDVIRTGKAAVARRIELSA